MLQKKVVGIHTLQTFAHHFLDHVLWASRREVVYLSIFINIPYTQFVSTNLTVHSLTIFRFASDVG